MTRQIFGLDAIPPAAQRQVGSIKGCRLEFHQQFPGVGLRSRDLLVLKDIFRRTELMDANGFHGTLLRSILIALLKFMKPNSKDSLHH